MRADAVFAGGGVKGIALAGAIGAFERAGYKWQRIAGTSAGSIVAALLAAGYDSAELKHIMRTMRFDRLLGRGRLHRIPLVGPALHLLLKQGLYSSDPLEQWMNELLLRKKIATFDHLPQDKLKIIVSDISNGRMVVLPDDLDRYGIPVRKLSIAAAVRMSTSIPFFFQPYKWKTPIGARPTYMVDGGLLSNYPIWLFDVSGEPRWPTFGFKLSQRRTVADANVIRGPITLSKALFQTMLQAHDQRHVDEGGEVRTIFIPTDEVPSTRFTLGEEEIDYLDRSGREAAESFLTGWDFERYKQQYRSAAARRTKR